MRPYHIIVVAVLLVCVCIALGACTTGRAVACPPLKAYTAAEQKALATALQPLDPSGAIALAMVDYERMRAADRACLAGH